MADNATSDAAEEPVAQPQAVEDSAMSQPAEITLNEYVAKLSQRDRRVELVNAFYRSEKINGTVKDQESNFDARFVTFSNQVIED